MARCPNCSYLLVFLKERRKYKCAKCGRLHCRKMIDDKEFREWNKQQKERDKEEFDRQLKLRRKTIKPRGRKKIDPKEKQRKSGEYRLAYYQKNRAKILVYKKEWRKRAKERNNQTRRIYRQKHKEIVKIWSRIHYWRQMQKNLAIEHYDLAAHFSTFGTTDQNKKFIY